MTLLTWDEPATDGGVGDAGPSADDASTPGDAAAPPVTTVNGSVFTPPSGGGSGGCAQGGSRGSAPIGTMAMLIALAVVRGRRRQRARTLS